MMYVDNPLDKFDPNSPEAKVCRSQPLGVHTLHASPTNPRKTFDPASMAELVASVRQHGILQPIVVRFWPVNQCYTGPDLPMYEVVCGERRYRAAREAGLQLIPGIVRDLDTKAVIELQLLENLQREDLHPLEEAEGYEVMMKEHGYTADALADKIGKSRSYVFGRTKLLQLDDEARRLFRAGLLNASTALLVARIPTAKLRAKAIKEITEKDYNGDTPSVRAAQRILQRRFMLRLAEASFPTDDATLVGGSCAACQKRTGNQPADLFDDVDSPDVCTDPDCFTIKAQAHKDRLAEQAKEAGKEVITGAAAKKIAGQYGISEHSRDVGKGYIRLDATCYDDPGHRTYREIVGDAIQETLIEDERNNRLVPVVKNTILADKLKEAGIETGDAKREKEQKKNEAKAETERAVRERLFDNIRTEVWNYTLDGAVTFPDDIMLTLLRDLVVSVFHRAYDDTCLRMIKLWDIEGKNNTERKNNFPAFVAQCDAATCWKMLVDMRCAGELSVHEYAVEWKPEKLESTARLFSIDPDEVRKDVISERKAQEKAEKQAKKPATTAKKGKKPAASPAAEAAPPIEAARAGEDLRAENPFKVGDRVCVSESVVSVRIGLVGKTAEARDVDETAVLCLFDGADLMEWIESEHLEHLIETNETPTGAETTEATTGDGAGDGPKIETDGEFSIGDRVRVKNDVRGPAGNRRKCCGRTGVIEAFAPGGAYIHVRLDDNGSLVTNLVWNEIEKNATPIEAARAA